MRFLKLSFYTDSVVTLLIASSVLVVFSFAADKFIKKTPAAELSHASVVETKTLQAQKTSP